MHKRTAFITGASGFIGHHLIKELQKRQWTLRILVHNKPIPESAECECVQGDITNLNSLSKNVEGVDIVIHLAAALGASLISSREFHKVNILGTENVLTAAQNAGVQKVIHFSSAGVFGSVQKGETADESYPHAPKSIYDKTKSQGEKTALRYFKEGMEVVIVRPGWVYGPGDRRTFKLINAIAKKRFVLVARGKTWQTPVYIRDLIQGTLLCMDKGKSGETYHLAGKEVLSIKQITETIASALGTKIPPFSLPLWPVKALAWTAEKAYLPFKKEAPLTRGRLAFFTQPKPLSIQKATQELGYSPKTDFQSGMAKTIAWYRQKNWLNS